MMARWDLRALARALPELRTSVTLVAGERDKAVPPRDADRLAQLIPDAIVVRLPGLGHLAHEEDPVAAARPVLASFG